MPRHCCIPGCHSNYNNEIKTEGSVSCYLFPKNEELKAKWIQNIPRFNWVPSKHSAVCVKHFTEQDFRKNSCVEGRMVETELIIKKLLPTAVPTVFENLSKHKSKSRKSLDTNNHQRKQDRKQNSHAADNDEFHAAIDTNPIADDRIRSFADFKENVSDYLVNFPDWILYKGRSRVTLYILDEDDNSSIDFGVKIEIDFDMYVRILVKGKLIPYTNLNCIIPKNRKLMLWSQFVNILPRCKDYREIGEEVAKEDLVDNNIKNLEKLLQDTSLERTKKIKLLMKQLQLIRAKINK